VRKRVTMGDHWWFSRGSLSILCRAGDGVARRVTVFIPYRRRDPRYGYFVRVLRAPSPMYPAVKRCRAPNPMHLVTEQACGLVIAPGPTTRAKRPITEAGEEGVSGERRRSWQRWIAFGMVREGAMKRGLAGAGRTVRKQRPRAGPEWQHGHFQCRRSAKKETGARQSIGTRS